MLIQDDIMQKNFLKFTTIHTSYYYVFNLQKRIYTASKEGHISLVYSLQKLLLSLRSIKVLAKTIIRQKLEKITNNNIIITKSIVDITKQIIYWCLEAEWIPKIHCAKQSIKQPFTNKFVSFFLESFLFHNNSWLSNINYTHLINKIQPVHVIKNSIKEFLIKKKFTNYTKHQNFQVKLFFSRTDNLYHLLTLIVSNSNHWHYFRQVKLTIPKLVISITFFKSLIDDICIYTNIKVWHRILMNSKAFCKVVGSICQNKIIYYWQTYYIQNTDNLHNHNYNQIKLDTRIIKFVHAIRQELHQNLKDLLFHKDNLGRLRINNHLTIQVITEKIVLLFKKVNYYQFIKNNKHNFFEIRNMVNEMYYYWLKKKYKKTKSFQVKVALSLLKLKLDNLTKLSTW